MTFGDALRRVRGGTKARAVAAGALPDAPLKQQLSFANYLSRIERGEVPNVGLNQLLLIAKGLGITLSSFFAQIEALQAGEVSDKTAASTSSGAADVSASPVSGGGTTYHREVEALRSAIFEAGKILVTAGLSGARKPDSAGRAGAAGRGARPSRRAS